MFLVPFSATGVGPVPDVAGCPSLGLTIDVAGFPSLGLTIETERESGNTIAMLLEIIILLSCSNKI